MKRIISLIMILVVSGALFSQQTAAPAQAANPGTRLLRQPSISQSNLAFCYGSDIWVTDLDGGNPLRLTSTPAVESNPHFSPDGKWIAFNSNRSGNVAVYVVSAKGGTPKRLTWHPAPTMVCGWSPDGKNVLYTSSRDNAPTEFFRLWTVPLTGGPSTLLAKQWANDGSFSPDGDRIIVDKVRRWDVEWRHYRGGQNTPLILLNLADKSEKLLPCESTIDFKPLWLANSIYFLSDRDWTSNIWSYQPKTGALSQVTHFEGADIKWLDGRENTLVFERDGFLFLHDLKSGLSKQLKIEISGDFPWAEKKWEDVSKDAGSVTISPTGKRLLAEARGDIFTIPAENGNARNLTQSSGAADHAPLWSPKGNEVAWFSDAGGKGYSLLISAQDGLAKPRSISIGESKMAWEPAWSPDGKYIAFTDNRARIRLVDIEKGSVRTVDTGGSSIERGDMGLTWSHDSKWLAYAKTGANNFRKIVVWSLADNSINELTDYLADSFSPAWDRDGRHLYFLASTNLALRSSWASTSSMTAEPRYTPYVINLKTDEQSPFNLKSDEEKSSGDTKPAPASDKGSATKQPGKADQDTTKSSSKEPVAVTIDLNNIQRRILSLPVKGNFQQITSGPAKVVFLGEQVEGSSSSMTIQKFTLEKAEQKEFLKGVSQFSVSSDGKKLLAKTGGDWKIINTDAGSGSDTKPVKMELVMQLDRPAEWKQIYEEAWRYEKDYFYDSNMHGRDWNAVYDKYLPLVQHVRHRADLNYVLDQLNGELSVGHSFVSGGDMPEVNKSKSGLLGADFIREKNRWQIKRIYTTENWNPDLSGPLDRPGIKIQEGDFVVGINGKELTDSDDLYEFLDGTFDKQTTLHINKKPQFEGSWQEVVKPIASETNLRQRAWVEDNRRLVDKLSGGKLAYIWVPNTGNAGLISFNRYYFAQQDKKGAVIDERFNGGGLLDDYMVDLMNRRLRAALTNEVPEGRPFRLPSGILGPKVLLINELSGSGGDFFPWVFRHQKTGPLIGATTWGGLVRSSVHYLMVDGGRITAPDNAVFDPAENKWVAENHGIAPDIEVRQDAASLESGIDPQLERAVREAMNLLEKEGDKQINPPPFSTPAIAPVKSDKESHPASKPGKK